MIFSFNEGDIAELCNSAYTFKIKTSKPPLGGKVEKNYLKKCRNRSWNNVSVMKIYRMLEWAFSMSIFGVILLKSSGTEALSY